MSTDRTGHTHIKTVSHTNPGEEEEVGGCHQPCANQQFSCQVSYKYDSLTAVTSCFCHCLGEKSVFCISYFSVKCFRQNVFCHFGHFKNTNQPCFNGPIRSQKSCTCIPMANRCDGKVECAEAEDETNCEPACDENQNRTLCHSTSVCIKIEWFCDGDNDCGDYSDETRCGKLLVSLNITDG